MAKALIRLPSPIRRGEAFEVKTLIQHAMESGQRRDDAGKLVPRQILHSFACTYNGREVVRMDLASAIAANPYIAFFMTANEPGVLEFTWIDDDGSVSKETADIKFG
jgi:sulfur-oxidizing protein SoxZ